MALTSWGGTRVRKADVTVAKNYLNADEIDLLNRLTTGFLDFAELRARNRQETRMIEWVEQTDRFLAFNERAVLRDAGRVSRETMEHLAGERFGMFDAKRRAEEAIEAERQAADEFDTLRDQAAKARRP